MNQKDRDSLTALLNVTKEKYQSLARQIHWSAADSERLDCLMRSQELQKDVSNRIMRATGLRTFTDYIPAFLVYKAWQRTRAVYSFNREFVEDMMQTGDTSLYVSLLEQLPFKDMLFFFSDGTFPKPKDEETAGMYVHIERYPEHLWIIFNYYDRKQENPSQVFPGIIFAFPITNGMKISQIFETPQYLEPLSSYKRIVSYDHRLTEQELEERLLAERKALNAAINLMYYLSAENADIKPIKHKKKPHKPSSNSTEDNAPKVKLHEVGAEYAEIIYRKLKKDTASTGEDPVLINDDSDESSEVIAIRTIKSKKKRRPHARRAHWQHYWTGKGRTTLVLRWKSDLFVGANRDAQATIVYDIKKEPLKGKQNPNTSKKKRNK